MPALSRGVGLCYKGAVRRAVRLYLIACAGLLVVSAAGIRIARWAGSPAIQVAAGPQGVPEASPTPRGPAKPVLLFFADPAGNGLVARRVDVPAAPDVNRQAAAALQALLKGPLPDPQAPDAPPDALPAVPPGVELRALFFDGRGTATVDLGRLRALLGAGGSEAEVLALWAVVDTLAFNFPVDARRVRILLDGNEAESLGGHVSLADPLAPRRDLVTGEIPSLSPTIAAHEHDADAGEPGADGDAIDGSP